MPPCPARIVGALDGTPRHTWFRFERHQTQSYVTPCDMVPPLAGGNASKSVCLLHGLERMFTAWVRQCYVGHAVNLPSLCGSQLVVLENHIENHILYM